MRKQGTDLFTIVVMCVARTIITKLVVEWFTDPEQCERVFAHAARSPRGKRSPLSLRFRRGKQKSRGSTHYISNASYWKL